MERRIIVEEGEERMREARKTMKEGTTMVVCARSTRKGAWYTRGYYIQEVAVHTLSGILCESGGERGSERRKEGVQGR